MTPTGENQDQQDYQGSLGLSDEDLFSAMQEIPGYLDITAGDLKIIYLHAFRHARERLTRRVTAQEIMTAEVAWVGDDDPLLQVAQVMAARHVSGVPVVNAGGSVVGVISEKDFLTRLAGKKITTFMGLVAACLQGDICQALTVRAERAADLMSTPAVTVRPETPVADIATLFREKGINRVPVTDSQGKLVGIVSRGDLVRREAVGSKPC